MGIAVAVRSGCRERRRQTDEVSKGNGPRVPPWAAGAGNGMNKWSLCRLLSIKSDEMVQEQRMDEKKLPISCRPRLQVNYKDATPGDQSNRQERCSKYYIEPQSAAAETASQGVGSCTSKRQTPNVLKHATNCRGSHSFCPCYQVLGTYIHTLGMCVCKYVGAVHTIECMEVGV